MEIILYSYLTYSEERNKINDGGEKQNTTEMSSASSRHSTPGHGVPQYENVSLQQGTNKGNSHLNLDKTSSTATLL